MLSNLLCKILGSQGLRAPTAVPPVGLLMFAVMRGTWATPRGPKIAPRSSQEASKIDQKIDEFSVSILERFGVVWGRQLGVIFGLFGAQVRPSSVQNAS